MTLTIVPRAAWGARYAAGAGPAPLPATEVWLHHSVTTAPDLVPPFTDEDAAMRQLEAIGQQRFGQGVSYTFAAMPSGRIYEGHGIATKGAHTAKRNSIARAIVLVGNYDVDQPHPQQIESCAQLLVDGWRRGWWTAPKLNGGHRDAPGAQTACPGQHGEAAVTRINARAAAIVAAATITKGTDVPLTKAEIDAVAAAVWSYGLKAPGASLHSPAGAGDMLRHATATADGAYRELRAGEGHDLDVDEEALADALAPKLGPFVAKAVERLPVDQLVTISSAVTTEIGRRLAAGPTPGPMSLASVSAIASPTEPADDGQVAVDDDLAPTAAADTAVAAAPYLLR